MPAYADLILVVLLGAGIWSSIQLATQRSPLPLHRIGRTAVAEGSMVALVWLLVAVITRQPLAVAALQSLAIGGVWSVFQFVARGAFAIDSERHA